jgi:hypothetical protein
MAQHGRNRQECVTIDDKVLFVHLLVISVSYIIWNSLYLAGLISKRLVIANEAEAPI